MFKSFAVLLFLVSLSCLVGAKSCIKDEKQPAVILPWGTYLAEPYSNDNKIAHFKNIRFGKAPVGKLRFAKSEFPDAIDDNSDVQDTSFGPSCIQAAVNAEKPVPPPGGKEDEDCLFLDVYVPYEALKREAELPVVVYIYGGAYLYGGKDTIIPLNETQWSLYDGTGVRDASQNGIIWVVFNYRMGAYGWLAGKTMEEYGTPNAGLYDQRLVFEWVQEYISQVKGDKDAVSAWGNSAGAGSIIHHLTAFDGTQEPLFQRAAVWSPAYQWAWDRAGTLEDTFQSFSKAAGCGSQRSGLSCLRKVKPGMLKAANQLITTNILINGLFPFGPSVDGTWVQKLASVNFQRGEYSNCSSMIVSHVWNEAGIFVRPWVNTTAAFTKFLNNAFPGENMQDIRDDIEEAYPATGAPFYGNQQSRVRKLLQDSTFVCNARGLYNAYRGNVFMMQYNFPPATHGSDLLAFSWYEGVDIGVLIGAFLEKIPDDVVDVITALIARFAGTYQRYFASHAVSGDPNYFNAPGAVEWPIADDDGNRVLNALKAGIFPDSNPNTGLYGVGLDRESTLHNCQFWDDIAERLNEMYPTSRKKTGKTTLKVQPTGDPNFAGLDL